MILSKDTKNGIGILRRARLSEPVPSSSLYAVRPCDHQVYPGASRTVVLFRLLSPLSPLISDLIVQVLPPKESMYGHDRLADCSRL